MEPNEHRPPDLQAIRPAFAAGEIVTHITDDCARGVVVAFMVRANNHSFLVQWGIEKSEWHHPFELRRLPEVKPTAN